MLTFADVAGVTPPPTSLGSDRFQRYLLETLLENFAAR
jgi:hypothetical protein